MVIGTEISKEIDRRIDIFLLEWSVSPTHNGYRYIKGVVAYMVANPGVLPYTSMKTIAKMYGINYTTFVYNVVACVERAVPPRSSVYVNKTLRPKDFLILCMNTVLQER